MIVYRIASNTPLYRADDLSGGGAAKTGGRWNPVGSPMVYCASSIALAYLETLVHLPLAALAPRNRHRVEIGIPDAVWDKRRIAQTDPTFPADCTFRLPAGVGHDPTLGSVIYGGRWLAAGTEALLVVPSVIVPEENNVLINPRHPGAATIVATDCGRVDYDSRFFGGTL